MDIAGSTALVTGANRGIGRRFVDELPARGAERVHAAARGFFSFEWVDVPGIFLRRVDTDMMAGTDAPAIDPVDVARASLDGVQGGSLEVPADDPSRFVEAALAGDPAQLYGPASAR